MSENRLEKNKIQINPHKSVINGGGFKSAQLMYILHLLNGVIQDFHTHLAFSKDEASSSNERDDSKRWEDRHNIGSFVQQSDRPVPQKKIIPKRPEATKRESVNTIESMLQMIGLCQGHPCY